MPAPGSSACCKPISTLLVVFAAWKAFLAAIAIGTGILGVAYDTSADILLSPAVGVGNRFGPRLVTRLTSWDAIYFTQVSRRGYLFEQEWAFNSGLPIVTSLFLKALARLGIQHTSYSEPAAGIFVANASHLLAILVLYRIGQLAFCDSRLALVAASLHIFSPAGLFLSAPYAESSFALLSFTGHLLFAEGCRQTRRASSRDALVLLSGLIFGLATAFRSNGILSGILFAWPFAQQLMRLPRHPADAVRRLVVLGLAGLSVACGSVIPQFVAWRHFCTAVPVSEVRPWCHGYLPSIYAFVQQHYWNGGFLRYWTLSNVPLFLLAAPMLSVLVVSGLEQLTPNPSCAWFENAAVLRAMVQPAAVAQVLLALLALTSYHVQIITRISSGYPIWYLWLARRLSGQKTSGGAARTIITFMVMYAAIQGVLFASFLPPA